MAESRFKEKKLAGRRDGLRLPPQTLESEMAFLGALMIRPEDKVE